MARSLKTRILNQLQNSGLEPDRFKQHYNGTVTIQFAKQVDDAVTARLFNGARKLAWRVLETLPGSEVIDYFDCFVQGGAYHTIILDPVLPARKQPARKAKRNAPARPAPAPKPAKQTTATTPAADIGQSVWVAVRYKGAKVRITGQVMQTGDVFQVKSTRTGLVYDVPAALVFESRPDKSVLKFVQ